MQTARAMLDDGSRAIASALAIYGLPVDTVRLTAAAERVQDGEASSAAADWLALAHSEENEARLQRKGGGRAAATTGGDRSAGARARSAPGAARARGARLAPRRVAAATRSPRRWHGRSASRRRPLARAGRQAASDARRVAGRTRFSLDVYAAVESYEEYGLREAIVDTHLDQARSLSAEEPSLTGLAVQLVSLGLNSAVVAQLFREAVTVRRLALSNRSTDDAIRALDRLGEPHGLPHLGEEVAAEARASSGAGRRSVKDRGESAAIALEGVAQSPRMTWRKNPDGVVRTTEEAVDLARKWGVEIYDDIRFAAWDPASLPKNTHAEYFSQKLTSGVRLSWGRFLNAREELPVKISRDILSSDEAIVAVIAHEMHEINGLRRLFESRETIPAEEVYRLISPGIKGNLHDQAWDVADEVVARMRTASTRLEAP